MNQAGCQHRQHQEGAVAKAGRNEPPRLTKAMRKELCRLPRPKRKGTPREGAGVGWLRSGVCPARMRRSSLQGCIHGVPRAEPPDPGTRAATQAPDTSHSRPITTAKQSPIAHRLQIARYHRILRNATQASTQALESSLRRIATATAKQSPTAQRLPLASHQRTLRPAAPAAKQAFARIASISSKSTSC